MDLLNRGLIPELPTVTDDLRQLEQIINHREDSYPDLRQEARAHIVWHPHHQYRAAPFALVYLHGFTASLGEGEPVHRTLAHRFGMNLYLARLAGHGRGPDGFHRIKAQHFVESAAYALAVGRAIGKRVILMGTSTGAALALHLAAHLPFISGLILYSPLIRFYRSMVSVLGRPSVQFLTKLILGKDYITNKNNLEPPMNRVWDPKYRLEGLTALVSLIRRTMRPNTFQRIHQPAFLGYYYKNEEEQDTTVSVKAMLEMFDQLATDPTLKRKCSFSKAEAHVIGSSLTSKSIRHVLDETDQFIHDMLDISPYCTLNEAVTFIKNQPLYDQKAN
jgi:pimeloyl-ACP methyl ester carboxylesterase